MTIRPPSFVPLPSSARVVCLVAMLVVACVMAAPPCARAQDARETTSRPFESLFSPDTARSEGERPPSPVPLWSETSPDLVDGAGAEPAQNATPPAPQHTGLGALVRKSAGDFKAFPRRRSTYVILAIGGGAALLGHPLDDSLNDRISGSHTVAHIFAPGKYIGYAWVQATAALTTYIVGRTMKTEEGRTNKVSHLGFDLLRANILTQALTYGVKGIAQRNRPDGACCSFPSGHASVTFASASVLERHFGYRAAWPTFVIAGYVAASRLHDNRHFLSDVLFGSALGIASGWTVVGEHGRDDYGWAITPTKGGVAASFTWTPGTPLDRRGP